MRKLRYGVLLLVLAIAGAVAWRWYSTTRPEYRLQRGEEALRNGDWEKAARLAARLEASGYPAHAHLLRGEAYCRRQQWSQALAEFNQIDDQGEIRLAAAALWGRCLLRLGNLREAEAHFRFVIDQQPDHLEAHRGLADIYYFQGALPQAIDHLRAAARLDARDGRPERFLGLIYKDLGQHAEAVASYQEALHRDLTAKETEQVREQLAECLVKRHEYAEALEVLAACSPEAADKPGVLALRAECLFEQSQVSAARDLLDRALEMHPRAAALLSLRARIYLVSGDAGKAASLLEQAVEADRHDSASRQQLAQAYRRLGRAGDADEQLALAKQSDAYRAQRAELTQQAMNRPWDAKVRRRLAEVCRQLERPEEVTMWLGAAAACPPAPKAESQAPATQ
jgi:tetratricopeptide (TPR) repeat protein